MFKGTWFFKFIGYLIMMGGCLSWNLNPSNEKANKILGLTENSLLQYIQLGTESLRKQEGFELRLIESGIVVRNGSISHVQLLDSIMSERVREDNNVAKKMLRACQYIYNSKCAPNRINGTFCEEILAATPIPQTSSLNADCKNILQSRRGGHNAYRRLLPKHYRDGFYEMFTDYTHPSPMEISQNFQAMPNGRNMSKYLENYHNLAFIQWAQFIEHDVSKPALATMRNGAAIECCNRKNYRLQPRHHHPSCAPLIYKNSSNLLGQQSCLNYVRTAVAITTSCNLGSLDQMNQATPSLDLSQLYGSKIQDQNNMRAYKNGYLKATNAPHIHQILLPIASDEIHKFCALNRNSTQSFCFMAGDARVNSNPLSIIIYTIFQRNHNRIANLIQSKYPDLDDESIFQIARKANVRIYREIVFNEWLPSVIGFVGEKWFDKVSSENLNCDCNERRISNEFAVAASRFYLSMIPENINISLPHDNMNSINIVWGHQSYKPTLITNSKILTTVLENIFHQMAMKVDASYVDSLRFRNRNDADNVNNDALAFDIQRCRDHGLQSYIKYIEYCDKIRIKDWEDLREYMQEKDIEKLKLVYHNLERIDLMVGGLLEKPTDGAIFGRTFSCILLEQFAKLKEWTQFDNDTFKIDSIESWGLEDTVNVTAFKLVCINSDVDSAPINIFRTPSVNNPLRRCSEI